MKKSLFVFLLKSATLRALQSHPMYPFSYVTYISLNYIPLSHPHYIHHTKDTQKIVKPLIDVMIGSQSDRYDNTQEN